MFKKITWKRNKNIRMDKSLIYRRMTALVDLINVPTVHGNGICLTKITWPEQKQIYKTKAETNEQLVYETQTDT